RVREAVKGETWIVDGNYKSRIHDLVWTKADTVVWLDSPLLTILGRLFLPSIRRSWRRELLWGSYREAFRNNIFQRNPLLAWILTSYRNRIVSYTKIIDNLPAGTEMRKFIAPSRADAYLLKIEGKGEALAQ